MPLLHDAQVIAVQASPHPPQLFWSVVVSLHTPLQSVPVAQAQLLAMQLSPPPVLQLVPQAPQLPLSTVLSVHEPLQSDSLPVQPPHTDPAQVWRAP
jgi:hypothetical protein